ncbi:Phosphoribosyl-AMP cyclohydrolase [Candidatus Calditenuaceae archaeon HR02]|nr:Phosphoribosyl-AMP cyclohydrolase [Candidatus Calditenuaceae archaeon HR02]
MSGPEKVTVSDLDFSKLGGLVSVIVQDYETREVLMFAHANRDAVERTVREGLAYFFSRSRGKLWLKGETSGNYMRVVEILVDCDGDAIIYRVIPEGPACHLGTRTCFTRLLTADHGSRIG